MHIILMIVGAVVAYLLLKTYYVKNWNRKLNISIHFSVTDAVCGATFELVEVVSNEKRLPLPFIHLKFQASSSLVFKDGVENSKISDATYRDDVFSLLMNQRITRRIPVTCNMRGVYFVKDIETVFTGLFMDDVCVDKMSSRSSVTIYPDPYFCEDADVLYSRISGLVERNSLINPDLFAFRQIREYDTSDPMNTINWKASARTGELMVNQYNETTCQEAHILLNLEPEGVLVYERLDEASVSLAAGIAQSLLENGVSVGLVSNGTDYETKKRTIVYPQGEQEHIDDINTALARIGIEPGLENFASMIRDMTDGYNSAIFDNSSRNSTMYIIISQNTRTELFKEMNSLIGKESQAIFIAPHFKDKEVVTDEFNGIVIPWEVSHNAKG